MSNSDKQRLVFLLGSGISYKAGMPPIGEITKKVLCGEGIYYYNEDFSTTVRPFVEPAKKRLEGEQKEDVHKMIKFLKILEEEIEDYYKKHPEFMKLDTNYEDLYFMIRQIYDSLAGEYDNPAVQAFVDRILCDISPLLIKADAITKWTLSGFAKTAMKYIEYVVFHALHKETNHLDYLSCIKEACDDQDYSEVDIFTLNHDTVLEKYLRQSILFTDGFLKPEREEHKYWKPSLFTSRSFKVRLFKLHGSINWFRFGLEDVIDWSGETIVIPSGSENYLITDAKGRIWRALDRQPMLLIGTYNKMLDYLSGIYTELHYQFYRSLSNVKQLVICGYGLGDRGINTQIVDWLCSSNNRRIIVVDPKPETLKNKYLSSISNKWDWLVSTGRLKIIPKGIEETCWHEIKDILLEAIG